MFDPDLIEDANLRNIIKNGELTYWGWDTESPQVAAIKAEGAAIAIDQLFKERIAVIFQKYRPSVILWGDMGITTVLGPPDPDDESGSVTFYFAEQTDFSHLLYDRERASGEQLASVDTTLSPGEIEFLMHCYYSPEPFPRIHAPFFRDVAQRLLELGIIHDKGDDVYRTTDAGNEWVWEICRVPHPHNRAQRKGG